MFPHANPNRLIETWPTVCDKPFVDHNIRIDMIKYPICEKIEEAYRFLTFLKLIPTTRVSFDNAVNSFLTYSDVCN